MTISIGSLIEISIDALSFDKMTLKKGDVLLVIDVKRRDEIVKDYRANDWICCYHAKAGLIMREFFNIDSNWYRMIS